MADVAFEMEEEQAPDPLGFLAEAVGMQNIAEHLDDDELGKIGEQVIDEYELDADSMSEWRDKMDAAIKLAKLVKEDKNYPFRGAANVKYPLVTTAALQFNAKAYPAIVAGDGVVKAKVYGNDPTGQKAARAERVAEHMTYDLTVKVEEWEEDTDKLLVILPIVGTCVRKWWYDPAQRRKRCRLVEPGKFIVNDKVRLLSEAPRCSEEICLYPNEISERIGSRLFRNIEYAEADDKDTHKPEEFIEQHTRLDLDEDGYNEPYIVTVHKDSRKVARIVADFGPEDVTLGPDGIQSIRRGSYFVAYQFIPGLDGGFWGTGLGVLLGDITETINTTINQMLDAGHRASMGGGFLGSEFRIKGGSHRFEPGEWKLAQARGADIKNAIVPLTFPGPDATLFNLLNLLIEAGKEVSSTKDILSGEASANMPATTTLALIEQGMAVFTASYKRIYRSLKQEFKLIARLNAETVDPMEYSQFHDLVDEQGQPVMLDPRADYGMADMDICPVADPHTVTKMQSSAKAQIVAEMAQNGMADPQEAAKRVFEAANVPDVEELMPKPNPMAEAMGQLQMQAAQADVQLKMVAIQQAMADIDKTKSEMVENFAQAASAEHKSKMEEIGKQLDAYKLSLEERKMKMEAALEGLRQAYGGSDGGVAGSSGNGNRQGSAAPFLRLAQAGGDPSLLGGDALGRGRAPGRFGG